MSSLRHRKKLQDKTPVVAQQRKEDATEKEEVKDAPPPAVDGLSIVGALFPVLLLGFVILSMLVVGVLWPWRSMKDTPPPIDVESITSLAEMETESLPVPQYFEARNGVRLAYRSYLPPDQTPGCAVVLLHSVGLNSKVFHPLAERLAMQCSAFALDTRAHGSSGSAKYWPGGVARISQLVQDVEDFTAFLQQQLPKGHMLHFVAHGTAASLLTRVSLDPVIGVTFVSPLLSDSPQFVNKFSLAGFLQVHRQRVMVLSLLNYARIGLFNTIPTAAVHFRGRSTQTTLTFTGLMAHCPSLYHSGRDSQVMLQVSERSSFDVVVGEQDTLVRLRRDSDLDTMYKQRPERSAISVVSKTDHMSVLADPSLSGNVLDRLATPA